MQRLVLSLIFLPIVSACFSQEINISNRNFNTISIFQGVGWTTANEFVQVQNPNVVSAIFTEHFFSTSDWFRVGLALNYMRVPYELSYYSAGVVEGQHFIWKNKEEITTHSIHAGISFNYIFPSERKWKSLFKISSFVGVNFLEKETESREFEFKRNSSTNLWESTERPRQIVQTNQSRDVSQWHLSLLTSYAIEKDISRKLKLSWSIYYLTLTGGMPTGPYLAFRSPNNFPTNAAGEPRLQVLKDLTHVFGISVGIGFSNFSAQERFNDNNK